jgi:hypothetical protein
MPLGWKLTFQIDKDVPEKAVECIWISPNLIDLRAHYSKKMRDAIDTTIDSAKDAIKSEITARKELHAINNHKRLSALVVIGTDDVEELHQLLAWITLKEPHDMYVQLYRYTKDIWSDGVLITEAKFSKVVPIGQRFYAENYIFDFQLGGGVEYEDVE